MTKKKKQSFPLCLLHRRISCWSIDSVSQSSTKTRNLIASRFPCGFGAEKGNLQSLLSHCCQKEFSWSATREVYFFVLSLFRFSLLLLWKPLYLNPWIIDSRNWKKFAFLAKLPSSLSLLFYASHTLIELNTWIISWVVILCFQGKTLKFH